MDEPTAANANGGESVWLQSVEAYRKILDQFLTWTAYISGGLFALTAFFITYDVLARKWGYLVGLPTTRVTDEISGYVLVLSGTWGLAYTLRTEAHVRIDVLLPFFERIGLRFRAMIDILSMLCMGYFALIVAWKCWSFAFDSLDGDVRSSTYLLTPLYLPQSVLAIGFSMLTLTALSLAAFDLIELGTFWKQPERLKKKSMALDAFLGGSRPDEIG